MTTHNEAELIAEAQAGSLRAFEQLYRAHSARVFGLCVRLCDSRADAEDATQETFIKAWRALPKFRGDSRFTTWLHRIAFNEAAGIMRKDKTAHRHLEAVPPSKAAPDASLTEMDRLERAIGSLPPRAREALVLHKLYGYTHEETAEFMGIAVGTCKAQVHRAVQLLQKSIPPQASTTPEVNRRAIGDSNDHE